MSDSPQNISIRQNKVGRSQFPFFALIIGIDDYANWSKLGGAVADAKAMKEYLVNILRVAEDHIVTLYNKEATRNKIIKAFKDLKNDERIKKGDPIVIFYAGHGAERPAPPAWCVEGKIQCLVPQDCVAGRMEPPPDRAPILDRTIGALIQAIAEAKGDNITVILDCNNSAWYHGPQSHILLAACGKRESAFERRESRRGQFTSALLETLESCAINGLTYAELLNQIHLEDQHPQCEGSNRHRVLFNARMPVGKQVYYPVHDHKGGKYVISAGLAHGVSRGVELTLYNDRKRKLGVVLVDEISLIRDFETTITTFVPLTGVSLAQLTRVGKLPLYVDNHSTTLETLRRVDGYGPNQQFRIVGVKEARLEAAMEDGRVVFKVLDERVKRFGLTKLPHEATLNNVAHVLDSAAHYYWFVGLAREQGPINAQYEVTVDFNLLNIDYDVYGIPLGFAVEPGFCQKDPNSGNSDVIDFIVNPRASYGIKITNKTPWDLYLNVFLFNNSDLSIVPYYTQSSAGKPEVPLKKGGIFTIGYGTGGTPPLSYSLQENQDIDVSFLKIFLATLPIDLFDIAQPSPFSHTNARKGTDDHAHACSGTTDAPVHGGTADGGARGGWSGLRAAFKSLLTPKPVDTDRWFSLDIPVVQRPQREPTVVHLHLKHATSTGSYFTTTQFFQDQ